MDIPTKSTPVQRCVDLAAYSSRMLMKHGDDQRLAVLGVRFEAGRLDLVAAERDLGDAKQTLVMVRVDVVFENHASDKHLRRLMNRVEIADGRKGGRLSDRLFPNGVRDITRRQGQPQVERMRALEARLTALQDWADAPTQLGELTSHRETYETALASRSTAERQVVTSRAARNAAKERFLDLYAEIAGQIRSIFPRDRRLQNLFFDAVAKPSRGRVDEPDEEVPEEPADDSDEA